MCLSLASPPHRILAHLNVQTTLSKKFTDRNQRPMSNARRKGGRRPLRGIEKRKRCPSWQTEWAIPSQRADQARDCGAAEIQRVAENAPCWSDINLAAESESEQLGCGAPGPVADRLRRVLAVHAVQAGDRELPVTSEKRMRA